MEKTEATFNEIPQALDSILVRMEKLEGMISDIHSIHKRQTEAATPPPDLHVPMNIDDMVAFMVENPTIHFDGGKQIVPKDPKKQNNRAKLDIGKIGALLRAGWSMAKIADEMGVSAQTIANHKEEALALLAKQDLAEAIENDIQEV